MRRLLLAGATAFCLWVLVAADAEPEGRGGEAFPEKDGVLQLRKSNFHRVLRKHKQLLVLFRELLLSP